MLNWRWKIGRHWRDQGLESECHGRETFQSQRLKHTRMHILWEHKIFKMSQMSATGMSFNILSLNSHGIWKVTWVELKPWVHWNLKCASHVYIERGARGKIVWKLPLVDSLIYLMFLKINHLATFENSRCTVSVNWRCSNSWQLCVLTIKSKSQHNTSINLPMWWNSPSLALILCVSPSHKFLLNSHWL